MTTGITPCSWGPCSIWAISNAGFTSIPMFAAPERFCVGRVTVLGDAEWRPLTLALVLAAGAVLIARRRAPVATLAISGALVLALFAVDHTAGAPAMFAPAVA